MGTEIADIVKVEVKDTVLRIRLTQYRPEINEIIKSIPDRRWWSLDSQRYWTIPNSPKLVELLYSLLPELGECPVPLSRRISTEGIEILDYLMVHQQKGLITGDKVDSWGFFWETGTGKTLLGLELIKRKLKVTEHLQIKPVKALLVCPLGVIEDAWVDDINKWIPELRVFNLWEARKKKILKQVLRDKPFDLAAINFESFKLIRDDLEKANFDILIIDESSKMKNSSSQITKAIRQFSRDIRYCYAFSGTPWPNDLIECYSQVDMLKPGLLGPSPTAFKKEWGAQDPWHNWKVVAAARNELMKKVSCCCEFVRKLDVTDLPPKIDEKRSVILSKEEMKAYRGIRDDLCALLNRAEEQQKQITFSNKTVPKSELITVSNVLAKTSKLRQITAGFIYQQEHDDAPRIAVPIGTSKLKALKEVLEEIGDNQVIIWAQHKWEFQQIEKVIGKKGKTYYGDTPHRERTTILQDFKNGKLQYLVAHEKTLGHGVRLECAWYAVMFSMSYSYENHDQSKDRMWRKGQVNKCTYIYLLAKGTVDSVIYNTVSRKRDVSTDSLKQLLREEA